MGEQARRKHEQHIHEAVSDFISRVNPRISTGPSLSLRISPSRDSSYRDGPQPSASSSSRVVHALSFHREKFRELRWLFVSRRRRWRSRHVFLLAKVISSGKRGWQGCGPLQPTLSHLFPSPVSRFPATSRWSSSVFKCSGMHGRQTRTELPALNWRPAKRQGRLVVMEWGEKKVGRLAERSLPFSFLFTRHSVMRSKISSKYQADTALNNLIQYTRQSYIPFF